MQKQGEANCPMCRSPCLLTADRCEWFRPRTRPYFSNVFANLLPANLDWALMNFMADWFPVESREKLRSNEREANAELAQQLGLGEGGCLVM
jgi:hypothetical protein